MNLTFPDDLQNTTVARVVTCFVCQTGGAVVRTRLEAVVAPAKASMRWYEKSVVAKQGSMQ